MGKTLYFIATLQEQKRLTEQFDSSESLVLAKKRANKIAFSK
jgi:hypothetical protein